MLEEYLCVKVRVLQKRFSEEFVFETSHMVIIMTQYERVTTIYSGLARRRDLYLQLPLQVSSLCIQYTFEDII